MARVPFDPYDDVPIDDDPTRAEVVQDEHYRGTVGGRPCARWLRFVEAQRAAMLERCGLNEERPGESRAA